MKNILHQIKLFILYLTNQFLLCTHKFDKELTILSSKKYKNKVKEDLVLQKYLLKNNIKAKIIAWEDELPNTKYILIKSIWGYHLEIAKFTKYLETINNNHQIIFNDYQIIKDNFNKEKQINFLDKYSIHHIPTKIVYDQESLEKNLNNDKLVIKPIISASGNNTFLYENNKDDIILKCQPIINNGLMIQPFIEEIKNGELSIILLNNEITHCILRYPGIFTKTKSSTYIDKNTLDQDLLSLIEKIKNIKEYQNNLYMRIDLIKLNNTYQVMEIELVEPQLFFEWLPKSLKQETYLTYVNNIKSRLK